MLAKRKKELSILVCVCLCLVFLGLHVVRSHFVNVIAVVAYFSVIVTCAITFSQIDQTSSNKYLKYSALLAIFLAVITLPYWLGGRGSALGWYDEIDGYIGWSASLSDAANSYNPYWAGGSPTSHGFGKPFPLLAIAGNNPWLQFVILLFYRLWSWSLILFSIAFLNRKCQSRLQKAAVITTGTALLVSPRIHWGWVLGGHGLSFALIALIIAYHFNCHKPLSGFLMLSFISLFSVWMARIGLYESGKILILAVSFIGIDLIYRTRLGNMKMTLAILLGLFAVSFLQQYSSGIGIGLEKADFIRFSISELDKASFYQDSFSAYRSWIQTHIFMRPENSSGIIYLILSMLMASKHAKLARFYLLSLPLVLSASGFILAGLLDSSVLRAYRYLTFFDLYSLIAFIALNLDLIDNSRSIPNKI